MEWVIGRGVYVVSGRKLPLIRNWIIELLRTRGIGGMGFNREIDRAQFVSVGLVIGETPGRVEAGADDKHREKNAGWAHGGWFRGWNGAVPVP